ncbi:MAG TPA: hypothetical protein VL022_03015 [Moheibacter sp.]|nr:hypothetical protein [Moheibacter sp.]
MKSKLFIFLCLSAVFSMAQVGIGTQDPKATLDIVGSPTDASVMDGVILPRITGNQLAGKSYGTAQQGAVVYVTAAATALTGQVVHVNAAGLYYFDGVVWRKVEGNASNSNNSAAVYSASKKGGWSLLNLSIDNWAKVNLLDLDASFGGSNIDNGEYVAPSTGYYQVTYEWQLESGLNIDVLGTKELGVIKNPSTTAELVHAKIFDAVRVSVLSVTLASVPLTSTTLTTLVQLDQGDRLAFVADKALVGIGLLNNSKVSVNVHKVVD